MNRENVSADGNQQSSRGDTSDEMERIAYNAFENIARPGFDYIVEEDLLRFMTKEAVADVFSRIDGAAETGKITRKAFTEWMINVEMKRRDLVNFMNDKKRVLKNVDILLTTILMVISVVIWLYLQDFVTLGVLLTICVGLVALTIMFAIIFKNLFTIIQQHM